MTAHLYSHKLSYISAPKVACTSLKHFMWTVENGREFRPYIVNSKHFGIHDIYRAARFKDLPHQRIRNHQKFAIVRDPVERFLSCYANRVVFHKELSAANIKGKFKKSGLLPNPSIHQYIERFQDYRATSKPIFWHSRLLVSSLGRDVDYYHRIYKFSELPNFAEEICDLTGNNLTLPHLQTGGPKISRVELSKLEIQKIKDHYAKDYDVFQAYFD